MSNNKKEKPKQEHTSIDEPLNNNPEISVGKSEVDKEIIQANLYVTKLKRWIREYNPIINLIAFLFAIIAIGMSIAQTTDLKELLTKLEKQTSDLEKINDKIPTQTIKAFPGNLSFIIDKILNDDDMPKEDLLICTDVLGYGFLSNHEKFLEYERQLMKILIDKEDNVRFDLLIYEDAALKETFDKQYLKKKETIEQVLKNSTCFSFCSEHGGELLLKMKEVQSYEEFSEFLFQQNMEILTKIETLSQRNELNTITRVPDDFPFFMWILDDRKAVISFPNYSLNVEHAFYTTDRELIKNFKEIFSLLKEGKYWK